nr:hypothetical protein [uncultured Bacillus sp.]
MRILAFLFLIALLLWGTSEYILSISEAVLTIAADIQQTGFLLQWLNIFILTFILALPFAFFLVIYLLFMRSIIKYRRLKEGD